MQAGMLQKKTVLLWLMLLSLEGFAQIGVRIPTVFSPSPIQRVLQPWAEAMPH